MTDAAESTKRFVVHCKRDKFDVYIGRPSPFGNPFSHAPKSVAECKVETREDRLLHHDQVGVVVGSREQTKSRGSVDHLVIWGGNIAWFANDQLHVIWAADKKRP